MARAVLAMDAPALTYPFPWTDHYAPAIAKIAYLMALQAIHDEKGIRMGKNHDGGEEEDGQTSDVDRTFAVMLGEVEDLATRLTLRQSELAKELASVEAELHRVEGVRGAMTGRPKVVAKSKAKAKAASEKAAKILAWATERGGEWAGAEAADFLGVPNQGVGPVLAGMTRRDELRVRVDDDGKRLYSVQAP